MIRRFAFLALFASAVGIPIAASNSGNIRERVSQLWNREPVEPQDPSSEAKSIIAAWNGSGGAGSETGGFAPSGASPPGSSAVPRPTVTDLSQVIRFDVSPEWVRANWARNSTALGEPDTYAIRVPVVTGTALDDIAGAVTYYFDEQRQVSRIFLNGSTGDPRKLIALASTRFQMLPQRPRAQGEQFFQYRWNDEPIGELAIRPADSFSHEDPYSNYQVELDVFSTSQSGSSAPRRSLFGSRPSMLQPR